jgi:hypothetical protein
MCVVKFAPRYGHGRGHGGAVAILDAATFIFPFITTVHSSKRPPFILLMVCGSCCCCFCCYRSYRSYRCSIPDVLFVLGELLLSTAITAQLVVVVTKTADTCWYIISQKGQ